MVVTKILERAGHRATIVNDGEAALDVLNVREFDLVLMDVNMPVMNGIEATKLYRFASLGRPRIPIVALTADATAEVGRRCEEAGMDACVTKPIEPRRLLRRDHRNARSQCRQNSTIRREHKWGRGPHSPRARASAPLRPQPSIYIPSMHSKAWVVTNLSMNSRHSFSMTRPILCATLPRSRLQATSSIREHAHALRSAAANIGARRHLRDVPGLATDHAQELASRSETHLKELREEFERVRVVLPGQLSERNFAACHTENAARPAGMQGGLHTT